MLLPNLEVFFSRIKTKVVNSIKIREDLLLLQKLLKLHELYLIIMILCETSLGDNHILRWILLLKLNNLPIIGIVPPIHIAKLF
jgi:hypothetical protein